MVQLGVFDERATRRAVRRGVVRTALVAVVWIGVGLIGLNILLFAWQTRGDRNSHFGNVAVNGFFVSHPGLSPRQRTAVLLFDESALGRGRRRRGSENGDAACADGQT